MKKLGVKFNCPSLSRPNLPITGTNLEPGDSLSKNQDNILHTENQTCAGVSIKLGIIVPVYILYENFIRNTKPNVFLHFSI